MNQPGERAAAAAARRETRARSGPAMRAVQLRLAEVVMRWALSAGWQRTSTPHCWRAPDGTEVTWDRRWVYIDPPLPFWTVSRFWATSVLQAVDVLAAYGIVPASFAPLYAAGRASAAVTAWTKEARGRA
jgi:hypothetical protein